MGLSPHCELLLTIATRTFLSSSCCRGSLLRIARLDIRDNPVNHLLTHCLAALVNGDELVPTAVDEGELPQVLLGNHNKVIKTASHGED